MKKILSVLMALIMALSAVQCLSVVSFAADESETAVAEDHGEVVKSGNCGEKDENGDFSSNVTYELYEDGTLVISGNGAMPDFSYDEWVYEEIDNPYASYIVSEEYDYYIDRTIKAVKVEEGVTKIGANAFVSFVNLASVELPESITGIGTSAFYQCHAIESINIPDSVTYIKESAFAGCSGLKSLTIPKGVGSFGVGAFSGCTNLESVEFEGNTYISACCFYACNKLTTLILPATLKFIDSAFYNCNSLSDIYYNGTEEQWNSIRIVDQSNDALRNATIHYNYNPCDHNNTTNHDEQSATCTEDGYTAGVYCADCETWLSGHELIKKHHTDADGDKLCDICGKEAKTVVKQGNCGPYNYETYDYDSSVTYTLYEDGQLVISGSGAMADFNWNSEFPDTPYATYYFDENWNVTDTTVKALVIEDGVTHIGKNAFSGFAKLESAVIPDSVETIGEFAFANSAIKEINALKNVRYIDSNAFVNCNGISAIIIDNPECELNQCGFPPLTEIHGYKYTPAYDYAVENGNPFVEIGEWKTLDSISISSMPNKTTYKQGAPFRQTGLAVMLYFADGTAVEKTKGFTVSGFDSSEIGTCTLTVTYEDKTATFDVEIIEFVEPTINAGETINVEVEGGSLTFIKFVPTVTGTFTCTSVSYEDTYGYLYQADKETFIMSDDDSGMNGNFSMTCDLEAGNTYYWAVRYYSSDRSGSFDVSLTCDRIACAHENTTEHDEQSATCTENGYTAGVYCEDCGTWISGHALVLRHHTDEDGDRICDICGKEAKVIVKSGNCGASIFDDEYGEVIVGNESNTQFVLYDDGTLVISGSGSIGRFGWGMDDQYPRVPYASYAYDNRYDDYFDSTVKTVSIEDGITAIGDNVFYRFLGLESIVIPDSVTRIGSSAFYQCNNLKEVNFTGSQEQWENIAVGSNNSALYNAEICYDYVPCDHNNTTNHDEQAATCTENGYTAGVYCEDCGKWLSGHELIKKHHTDADGDRICDICGEEAKAVVKSGNCGASVYDEWHENIEGNEDNAQFVLYDDGELVISGTGSLGYFGYGMDDDRPCVPYASYSRWYDEEEDWDTYFDDTVKSVIIEDGITAIGDYAFYRFRSLEGVSIPDSVETINYCAFAYSGIKEINLPASVQNVGSYAFRNCNSLSKITFNNPDCEIYTPIPSGTEIHGYKYSTAYDCVLENGNSFVQIGEAKELESISISSMPYKTTFKQDTSFRQDGLIVALRFTDGTSVDKTRGFTVSGFDSSEIGTCTLTVTYEDKTAEFDVAIKENKEYVINSGETIHVDVEPDSITYIKFIPTIDGTFTFTPYDEGEMPYAYLYDADKNTLAYGYDSDPITYNFETGKTYYWGVSCCAVGYYSIDVNLTCDNVFCAHENTTEYAEQPATCTADGYTAGVQCNDCEKWLSGHELVLRHHTDEDGDRICDICGKEAKVIVKSGNCGASIFNEGGSGDYVVGNKSNTQFMLYDDGTLVISGSGSIGRFGWGMDDECPCVPYASYVYDNRYDDYYDSTVKTVIIEDGITDIGENAFYRFCVLENIVIPESVTRIGGNAFYECRSLKEVNFTGTQEQWENISVEWNNSALSNAEICYDYVLCDHNNTTNHAEQAETCTADGYTAGIYCEDCGKWIFGHAVIKKHHTDKDADNICDLCGEAARIAVKSGNCGASIFDDEYGEEIVGNEDNAQFVLYDDGTLVISGSGSLGGFGYGMDDEYPRIPYASYSYSYDEEEDWDTYFDDTVKYVIIEDGITAIGYNAFYRFRSLESVSIPDSVKTIDYNAFAYSAIKEVNLLASVYSVGSSAFRNCNSLSKITVNNPECDIFNSNIPYKTEIYGCKYSMAYDYATENGNSFVEIGEPKELESISISSMPNKTTYKQGAPFRQDGLIVTLRFTDGTSVDKTRGFTVSGFDSSEIGTCTLTVTCADKSTTFDVEIIEYVEPTINAGETINVEVDGDIVTYIKFVPTVSGTFTFTSDSTEDTFGYLYQADKETIIASDDDDGIGSNFSITWDLEAGKTYYWGVRYYYSDRSGSFDVSLTCDRIACAHENTTDYPEQPATCTAEGYTAGAFCEDCQTWASGHEIIFRHHTDEDNDGICDVCNKKAKAVVRSGYCGTYNRYTFDYDSNVVYILYDDGELVISGSGAMADFNWLSEFPDTPYASYIYDDMDMDIADMTVSSVVIENGVTRIGKNAFNAFKNLESVVIPESVTSIGYSAFYECSSLSEVNFTGTQEQWENISVDSYNSYLFNADIYYNYVPCDHNNTTNYPEQPATCTEDGFTAGIYCEDCGRWISGHKKIVKHHVDEDGDGICDICKDEFKTVIKQGNCGAPIYDEDEEFVGYEDVNYDLYDNGLLVISGEGQMRDFDYYDSAPYVDYLYDYNIDIFYDNTVKAVVIENGVTSVGDYAFSGFRSLSSVTIPESVTRIGDNAFSGCTALENINIPDSVRSIGVGALTKEISFEPATAYAFHEGVSDGYYNTDDDGESYYYYSHPDFENGDKLTVRNIDGTETEYTLTDGYFEAENASEIPTWSVSFRSNQYQNHWFPDGEYNYMTLNFGAAFCEVPVAVYDNPVESISVTLASPYVLMDRISSDETVHFRTGDVLTVNYTDKTSKEFVCKVDKYNDCTFTSSDGEKLNRVRINRDGDFSVGMNAATVNYAGKTCEFPVEVTQCTVESISASYRYTLYNGYDCQLDTCEEHDEWCTSEEYINDAYVLYSVNLTDGNVFTGTETEVYEEFGARPWTHIVLDRIGTNEGSVTLGDFIGTFTVNVEEKPSGEENLPTCYFNSFNLNFAVGQKVDYQLIQFADKGYTHSVNVISVPDGLTLSQDGRLTGTVTGRNSLEFDVRWNDTYVHEYYSITIYIYDASATVEIPEVDDLMDYDTRIYVEASESNPTWLKFRACNSGLRLCSFANDSYDRSYDYSVYTQDGVPVFSGAGGDGDGAEALYSLAIGEYYYIKVNFSGWIKLESPSWLPVWGEKDGLGGKIDYSLAETNVEKEFDGDSNTLWNVYKLEMPFHVDTNGGITYDIFGAMARFASPVNIHITSEATSNLEILNKKSYKFDPNNVEECEAIGASTEQDTLIDKLLPGEKEYRFDTVYYLMPEVADFDLVQTSMLYVPVGYSLTDDDGIGRITESCAHGNTETVTENEVPATCKEGGSYDSVTYCKDCGVEISRETVTTPKTAHTESAWITDKASDCVNGGTKHTECTVCGEVLQTAEIPANGHQYNAVVTAPTCTADGYTTHTCPVCGDRYTDTVVDKLGHSFTNYVFNGDATCTADGTKTAKCDRCDVTDTIADTGSMKAHTPAEAVTENEVPATCTANGSYDSVVYCSVCHTEISREAKATDKLGHSFTNYVSNNDATCTADGTKTAKCDRCDATDTIADTGSMKAHTETSIPAVPATCTETGLTEGKKCSVCGEILVAQEEIPAKGHTPGEWIIDNDSNCTNGGTKHQVCSVCGATIATQTIPAKGHSYEAVVTAPTCTADGYTTHTCKVCGNTYTNSVVKAKGHTEKTAVTQATTTKDGKIVTTCAVCGESLNTTVIYKASSIKLSATKYTYDGKTKTPTVTVKDSKGKTLTSGTDYTVKYATGRKNTGKYTVTVTFTGNYTGSKTLSFNILPGKTSKLTATQTTSSVKATWKSVTGASGYKVTLYSAKNKAIKTVYTTKTSASFTKLSKGTTYKVKVTAYKTIDGKKVISSVSTLLTTATKPGTPTLKATAGTKKATLSWNKQTGAAGYVVYMSTSKFGKYTKIATVKGGSKVSFTKTGLTKGKTYYFKVAAFETVGGKTIYGGYSAVKSVKVK